MIRSIIVVVLIYIFYRLFRNVQRIFRATNNQNKERPNVHTPKNQKSKVDKKDIIDAEFEEIKDSGKENK